MKTKPNSRRTLGIRGGALGGLVGGLVGRSKAGDGEGMEVLGGGLGEEAVRSIWRAIVRFGGGQCVWLLDWTRQRVDRMSRCSRRWYFAQGKSGLLTVYSLFWPKSRPSCPRDSSYYGYIQFSSSFHQL